MVMTAFGFCFLRCLNREGMAAVAEFLFRLMILIWRLIVLLSAPSFLITIMVTSK